MMRYLGLNLKMLNLDILASVLFFLCTISILHFFSCSCAHAHLYCAYGDALTRVHIHKSIPCSICLINAPLYCSEVPPPALKGDGLFPPSQCITGIIQIGDFRCREHTHTHTRPLHRLEPIPSCSKCAYAL